MSTLFAMSFMAACSSGVSAPADLNTGGGGGGGDLLQVELALPDGRENRPYTQSLRVEGGTEPYTFELTEGEIPEGLSLNDDTISGTPTRPGLHRFTVDVTDAEERTGRGNLRLFVSPQETTLELWTATLPDGTEDGSYDESFRVTGGTPPYSFTVTGDGLPAGLSLDTETGAVTGTPTESGMFNFGVTVTDDASNAVERQVCMSVVSAGGSVPSVSLVISHTTGTAPLAVMFDATGTTSVDAPKAFHHLDYQWDFGEPDSQHSHSSGPLAAHVYQQPGSYTAQLTVVEPDGSTVTRRQVITVTDPDSEFADDSTVCFSNDSDFSGAPSGSRQVTTRSFDDALANYQPGRRLLFKRGDSFTCDGPPTLVHDGYGVIGAFGDATAAASGGYLAERGIPANNPRIECNGIPLNMRGWGFTIMDLNFVDPNASAHSVFDTDRRVDEVLILRCQTEGFNTPIGLTHDIAQWYGVDTNNHLFIVDSVFQNVRSNTCYSGGKNLAFIGNRMRGASSHLLRLTFAFKAVIDGNHLIEPGGTRHAIKLHALQDRDRYEDYSEQIVIRDNLIENAPVWAVTLGPQDASVEDGDEWVRQVLVEKNTVDDAGFNAVAAFYVNAADTTLRNNVFLGRGGDMWDYHCIMVTRRGREPIASGVEIYNNTRFDPTGGHHEQYMVNAETHDGPIVIRNNLIYAPASNTVGTVYGSAATTVAGNSAGVDPLFVDAVGEDLRLRSTSPVIGQGASVPVVDDKDSKRRRRVADIDVGAYRH